MRRYERGKFPWKNIPNKFAVGQRYLHPRTNTFYQICQEIKEKGNKKESIFVLRAEIEKGQSFMGEDEEITAKLKESDLEEFLVTEIFIYQKPKEDEKRKTEVTDL